MQKLAARYEKVTGKKFDVKTNAQKIRGMSDEELKDWYCNNRDCGGCDFCRPFGCTFKDWLQQPYRKENKHEP